MQPKPSLSVVVPVFNEIETLPTLCDRIQAALDELELEAWEVLLVNDGSTDGSGEWLARYCRAHEGFRALHFDQNQGQTAAFDAGFQAAHCSLIATMDADLQNDPADIARLLEQLTDPVGVVCGVRQRRQDSWLRRTSSKIANAVRNYISGDNITDTGCSLKLFRTSVFERMPMFEGMHRFFPTLVKMEGYGVVEVTVSHHPRYAGSSKYGVWNRLFRSLADLLAVRWMKYRKLRYNVLAQPNPALKKMGSAKEQTSGQREVSHAS